MQIQALESHPESLLLICCSGPSQSVVAPGNRKGNGTPVSKLLKGAAHRLQEAPSSATRGAICPLRPPHPPNPPSPLNPPAATPLSAATED